VRLVVLALGLSLLAQPSAGQNAQNAQNATRFTYADALQRALSANPSIAAAQARRAIGAAGVAVAGERLNPEGRAEFDRDEPHQTYSFAFPLELGGKRARRINVAQAEINTADAEIAQLIVETRNAVRRAYFDRAITDSRLALLDDVQAILGRARDAARLRFEAGSAPRLEVLQAELEVAQAHNEEVGARGLATAARMRFNALLGIPADSPTAIAPAELEPVMTVEAALARAKSASAQLAVLDRRLDAQRARIALAKAMQHSDITPEGSYTHGWVDDDHFQNGWKAAVAITLPIFTTHKAGVTLEEATLAQLTAERSAVEIQINAQVSAAVAIADAQREEFIRYRDEIVPQAVQVETMADDAYRLGQTGIAAYLQALQATRDVRLRFLQAEADLQTALADLEQAIGAPLQP
jgi:cobalt-zinc-cadmium efflux system outer membrane protein